MMNGTTSALWDDLVAANRILFHHGIVDGFGHVSVRDENDPAKFVMSRYVPPGLVTTNDLRRLSLDCVPDIPDERHYSERYIHGEMYKARPDVMAVVHCHADSLIPFGVTTHPLRPVSHMGAFLGAGVPIFEIRDVAGMTDLLIRTPELGAALARTVGDKPMALMRGHGATFVGTSIQQVVYRAIYGAKNAMLQMQAMALGGEITFLAPEESALMEEHSKGTYMRPWSIWKADAMGA
jgi:HCOMODA/2-hydroxy-3-carboxy-muconic semialdehyde decarboxylase